MTRISMQHFGTDSVARALAIAAVNGGGGGGGAVDSVNGKTGVVVLNAEDVGALPDTTAIPTKTSDLTNDSGFIDDTYHDDTKQDTLPTVVNDGFLHANATTGNIEWVTIPQAAGNDF